MSRNFLHAGRAPGGGAVGYSNAQIFTAGIATERWVGPSGERAREGNANPVIGLGCGLER